MSEFVNIHARKLRDLIVPNDLGADLIIFKKCKVPVGFLPDGFKNCEALELGQIKDIVTIELNEQVRELDKDILSEIDRAIEAEKKLQQQITTSNSGIKYFKTLDQLNAFIPSETDPKQAYVFETQKNYLWVEGWEDEGQSALDQAKAYAHLITSTPENFVNLTTYKKDGKIEVSTSNGSFYQKVSVKAGERFLVKSIDYNLSKAWYLADNLGNIIDECKGFNIVSSEVIVIKENGAYLYANCPNSEISNFKLEKLSTYEHKTLDLTGDYPLEVGIAYISDNAERATAIRVGSPYVTSTVIRANEGDKFKIDARKSGIVKTYYFVAEDFTIVSSESNNEPDLKFVTVPQYAAKLIVCSDNSYNFSVLKANYFDVLAYEASLKPDQTVKKKLKDYYPQQPNYRHLLQEKCPKFYNKLRNKTGDCVVAITGTSLTQGNLYATTRGDATTRPPLLHTNDLASHIFDSLINYWHGQQYLRYDHTDLSYSASAWSVINTLKDGSNNDVWDDFDYKKNGLTKTTVSANASVSTVIPIGAWQFNFIYRSDSQSGNCTISIAEGNSKVEVFNGANWVEANSFVFSMLESASTETKGNTCYQKRLKMRCKNKSNGGIDSLATAKNITISKGNNSNRFNVVGFEWSPREYMLTFINAARGSHAWGLTGSPENLENYQDSDIWEFNPDLILCEVTAINWGAGFGQALKVDPNWYVNIAKKAFSDELGVRATSLYTKSEQFTKCEIIFYGDTVATSVNYDTLWDANKQPKFGLVESAAWNGSGSTEYVGRVKTIFENYEAVELYMQSKPYVFIPVVYQFKKLADDAFGNYPDAFAPTLADGDSLSFDRVHLNNNGAAFYAYLIKPLFENL